MRKSKSKRKSLVIVGAVGYPTVMVIPYPREKK